MKMPNKNLFKKTLFKKTSFILTTGLENKFWQTPSKDLYIYIYHRSASKINN